MQKQMLLFILFSLGGFSTLQSMENEKKVFEIPKATFEYKEQKINGKTYTLIDGSLKDFFEKQITAFNDPQKCNKSNPVHQVLHTLQAPALKNNKIRAARIGYLTLSAFVLGGVAVLSLGVWSLSRYLQDFTIFKK